MDLLLGLDVGTTATKALLFDLQGRAVASASYTYGLLMPQPKWVEQDAEELWRGVVETTRAVLRQIGPGDRVVALSQSSQAGTTIAVDAESRPVQNAISWMDERAEVQAQRVREKWGAGWIKQTTGWMLWGGLPLQHIAWLRENRPDLFARTRRFLFVNDFITWRLTGRFCMNPSDAGITQLMSVASSDWDERLLETAGIRREQLSPMCPSGRVVGTLTAEASRATGLPQSTLVVNGAHDQYCGAVGMGVTRPGRLLLSCGTAWVIVAVPESLEVGLRSEMMSISRHAVEGRFGALRSLGGVGASLEWFLDNIWGGEARDRAAQYAAVNEGVARSPAGAKGLLFLPLAGGYAAAFGVSQGGFVGLSLGHSRDDMARAVMEGIALDLRWDLDALKEAGIEIAELKMVGGAARSPIWPQIVADVSGVTVVLPTIKDAASCGAAILAGVGAGIFPDVEAGYAAFRGRETRLMPATENRALYDGLLVKYQELQRFLTERVFKKS